MTRVRAAAAQRHERPHGGMLRETLCVLVAVLAWEIAPPAAVGQAPIRMGNLGNADAGLFIPEDKGYFKEPGIAISLARLRAVRRVGPRTELNTMSANPVECSARPAA